MAVTFVDTVALIALVNGRDSLHESAIEIFSKLRKQNSSFVTSEFVLVEFANTLSASDFRERASTFIQGLQTSEDFEIIESSSQLFSRGFELYRNRVDKDWSLVDCISFVIMNEQQITEAFTQDRHFEQAGFSKLL